MEKEFRVKCECGSEAIHINSDNDPDYTYIDLSIWHYGSDNGLGFWQKIRYIWKILTKGKPYGDQICLSKEKAMELGKYLVSLSDSMIEANNGKD